MAKQDEEIVGRYFKERGWSVAKLDRPGRPDRYRKAVDRRICHGSYCFLCEVKTISSVRADIPCAPVHAHFLGIRARLRAILEERKKTHPDSQLIVPGEVHEFVYGDEEEFRRKYQHRKRNTEASFREYFAEPTKRYLSRSKVSSLPYTLRLDSDDLYLPTQNEVETFWKWLEEELHMIHGGNPSRWWRVAPRGPGSSPQYHAFYPIRRRAYETDVDRTIQVSVIGPVKGDGLEVQVHWYGMPNLDAITRNVEEASRQLESSASKEEDKRIPRIVVVAFEIGITGEMALEWRGLVEPHFTWLLEELSNLSALAVLEMVPNGTPPPVEEGLLAWLEFALQARHVPRFMVYHNPCLRDVGPLDQKAFSDNRSVQFQYISGNWQPR